MAPHGCKEKFGRPPPALRSRPVEKVTKNPAPCSPQATLAGQLVLLLASPGGGTAPKTVHEQGYIGYVFFANPVSETFHRQSALVHAGVHAALGTEIDKSKNRKKFSELDRLPSRAAKILFFEASHPALE